MAAKQNAGGKWTSGKNAPDRKCFSSRLPRLRRTFKILAASPIILLCGCFGWTDKNGTHHAIIVGVGHVSRGVTNGISASDIGAVGLVIDKGLSVGIVRRHEVEINPNLASNAIVSVKSTPFSLTVRNFDPYATNQPTTLHEEIKK